MDSYTSHCAERGLIAPPGLDGLLKTSVAGSLDGLLYRPDLPAEDSRSLAWALDLLGDAAIPPPPNLLPLLPVDDASIACAVCQPVSEENELTGASAEVVRWHFDNIEPRFQGAVIDSDAEMYVRSVAEELAGREPGLARLKRIAGRYQKDYVACNKRPRSFVTRPVQIACQNVIIGLAAFRQETSFDGLRVEVYLTCEVPHLATHEANRALTALMLCDAFQNGGTMEIRFGTQQKPQVVPPGLKRFARSRGFDIGVEDPFAITPAEARCLFLAITPMPPDLGMRAYELMDRGLISPERLCFTLLSPVWTAIELDYLLAISSRVASILGGGADPALRRARLAELEVARAALMIGTLYRRLDNNDNVGRLDGKTRVFEDSRQGVTWSVDEERGVVALSGVPAERVAWSPPHLPLEVDQNGLLLIVSRALPIRNDCQLVLSLQEEFPQGKVALLVPADMSDTVPTGIPFLLYPDRLSDLDKEIERRLLTSRVGRS